MIEKFLEFAISNPSLTLLVMGFLCSFIVLARTPRPLQKSQILEAFLSYFILFNIGIGYVNNFVMHTVFAEMVAEFIGWPNSPFQYEVGFASLGFGIVGLLAFRGSFGLRVASIVGPTFFLWGAAGVHIQDIMRTQNFAPGNAGVVFWTDIFLPIIGLSLLSQQYKLQKRDG
jgi:hypothetical protein